LQHTIRFNLFWNGGGGAVVVAIKIKGPGNVFPIIFPKSNVIITLSNQWNIYVHGLVVMPVFITPDTNIPEVVIQ
jgi:hypothetical protein